MSTFVTGATGFVGSAVVRHLLSEQIPVRVLVRPRSDRRNLEGLDIEVVEGDLRDRASLERAMKGCLALFHVAADYRLWARDVQEIYRSNVEGTRNAMLAAAEAGVERIVYTSSVATLGLNPDGTPSDEDTRVSIQDMIGDYKRSKYLAEDEVRSLVRKDRLPIVIVNPSTPIGPHDIKPTPTGRLVLDAARGRMPAYVDTGLNLVHVDDVAAGHVAAFRRGEIGGRYILGGENLWLKEILERIAVISGRRPPRIRLSHSTVMPIARLSEFMGRVTYGFWGPRATVDGIRMARKLMFFSSGKAMRDLNYHPRPVDEALSDAVDWFLHHWKPR
ncbi:MAG: Aurachin B dehydrogenase [Gammaproteobacteria bacterium]|nr:Aurachin B dehydrogenase [Gammaproteobacteria bacterium]